MRKNNSGHYEIKQVWIPGKLEYYCDQCSKVIDSKEIKTFDLSPIVEVLFNTEVHFCSYECLEQWINGDSKELNNLIRTLDNADKSDKSICITVEGVDGLRKLFEAW